MKSMSGFGGGVASFIMKTLVVVNVLLVFHLDASDSTSYSGMAGALSWNDLSGKVISTLIDPSYSVTGNEDIWILMVLMIMLTLPTLDIELEMK